METTKKQMSLWIGILILFSFATKLPRLDFPKEFYFDEVYHAFTATRYLHGDLQAYDPWATPPKGLAFEWTHPPLAKLIMTGSMLVIGEKNIGWRLPSVLFGTACTVMTVFLALELFGSASIALIAGYFMNIEGLVFAQSRIAMNDSYFVCFMLMTLLFYIKWKKSFFPQFGLDSLKTKGAREPKSQKLQNQKLQNQKFKNLHAESVPEGDRARMARDKSWIKSPDCFLYMTGISMGLAVSTKWTAFYLFIIIGADLMRELWVRRNYYRFPIIPIIVVGCLTLIGLSVVKDWYPPGQFLFHRVEMGFGVVMAFFAVLIYTCWGKFPFHKFTLAWILIPIAIYIASYLQFFMLGKGWEDYGVLQEQMWYYHTGLKATHAYQSLTWQWLFNLRPVWFNVDYSVNGQIANLYNIGNGIILWGGLMAVVWNLFFEGGRWTWYRGFLVFSYFMLWLPWSFSPRIMLFYHYMPAVPLLCIILARAVDQLLKQPEAWKKQVSYGVLGLATLWFIVFFPQLTGIHIKRGSMDWLYYALPGWR